MSDQGAAAKICIQCHQDCSGRPRVKDRAGRYVCKDCLRQMQAREQAAPASAGGAAAGAAAVGAVAATGRDVITALIDDAISHQPEACPHCGVPGKAGAVICVNCGFNKNTGKTFKTKVVADKSSKSERDLNIGDSAAVHLALWVIGGIVGGAVGAAIWTTVVYFTHYEVGYVASVVGAATGGGVMLFGRSSTNPLSGGIAVVLAGAAILAGKYFSIMLLLGSEATAEFFMFFDMFDGLWFLLAFAAAYQLGANDYLDD